MSAALTILVRCDTRVPLVRVIMGSEGGEERVEAAPSSREGVVRRADHRLWCVASVGSDLIPFSIPLVS